MLHLAYYLIEIILFILLLFLFFLYLKINALIECLWHEYIEQHYKDKKISYIGKKIVTALRFFTDVLVIFMTFFAWESLDYLFYTETIHHHIKIPWLSSSSYISVIYLYKLTLAVLISQYIYALPLIVMQIMKFVRGEQKST